MYTGMNMYVKFMLYAYIHFKFNYEYMKQYLQDNS